MKICLVAVMLFFSAQAFSLDPTHFTITRVTAPYFIVDANVPATLTNAYVGFEVVNNANSGVTYTNLKFTITSIGTSVAGQNYAVVSPASGVVNIGTLAPGQSKVCYYYVTYPANVSPQATFNVQLGDNNASSKTQSFVIRNRSSISANAGGTATQSFTNQDLIGGTVVDDVTYVVGNVQSGDESDFQVAVSTQYDPAKFTLLRTQVVSSTVPGIVAGATDSLYFITGSGSNGASVTIRWTFRITGYNFTNYLLPCAGATSGNTNYKYALNTSLGSGSPVTISASANPLTISKVSDKSLYLYSSTAVFTITIQNPGAYGITIDSITDELPAGFRYQSLDASSQVTGANSVAVPLAGATGKILFEGGVNQSGNTSYYIPAGGSIILKYSAVAPASSANNLVTNVRDWIGITQAGTAQNTVSVAATLPVSLQSFKAVQVKEGVLLQWITSSEVNSKGFEVERSGSNSLFEKMGAVAATGNTSGNTMYAFLDQLSPAGIHYYRIKILDQDMAFMYSPVVWIRAVNEKKPAAGVYPNPFVDNAKINLSLRTEMGVRVMLYDETGKLVMKKDFAGIQGDNTLVLDGLGFLQPGNFVLRVFTAEEEKRFKIIKAR